MDQSSKPPAQTGKTGGSYHAPAQRLSKDALVPTTEVISRYAPVQDLLNGYPDVAVLLNEHRQVVACNRALLDLLGLDEISSILGQRLGEAFHCIHSAEEDGGCGTAETCQTCGAVNAMLACQRTERAAHDTCRIATGDADCPEAWELDVAATPFTLDGERLMIFAARDISANKRREALERLFFHDTLNVAGGIQGLADLLSTGEPFDQSVHPTRLAALSRQLVEQIRAQRDLAAAERGDLAPRWSTVVVRDLFEDLRATYETHPVADHRRLVFRRPEDPKLVIQSDRILLNRVLGNLIKNALEASDPGNTVTISAHEREDKRICFSVNNETVMPRDVQLQVFKRSFSTKGGSGRGLGTFSVKLLTTRYLCGGVNFTSNEGGGTTFYVELARSQTPDWKPELPIEQQSRSEPSLTGRRILLAEDGQDNQRLIALILRKAGATVSVADNGQLACDAVMAAASRDRAFDVVLMDMQMPVMDGYEATASLRKAGYEGAIIALTAHSTSTDRDACLQAGCNDFARKPIDRRALIETVHRFCNRREVAC